MVAVEMQIYCIRFFNEFIVIHSVAGKKLPSVSYKLKVNYLKPNKSVNIFFVIIAVALLHLGECVYPKSLLELSDPILIRLLNPIYHYQ